MNYWWAVLLALMVGTVLWRLGIPGIGAELEMKGESLRTALSATLSPVDGGVALLSSGDATYISITLQNRGPASLEFLPRSSYLELLGERLPLIPDTRILIVPPDGRLKLLALLDQPLPVGQRIEMVMNEAYLDVESRTPHMERFSLQTEISSPIEVLSVEADASFNVTADRFRINGTVSGGQGEPKVLVAVMETDEIKRPIAFSIAPVIQQGRLYKFNYLSPSFSIEELDVFETGSLVDEFDQSIYSVEIITIDDYGSFGHFQGSLWESEDWQSFLLS